jgi:uncharacterized protein involved in response to NO
MHQPPTPLEPYRFLFPLGALDAVLGAAPWVLYAAGLMPYPAVIHRAMMIEGFELCFVMGFLLTAMPAFTRGERCRPWERAVAIAAAALFGGAALAGLAPLAHAAFLAAVIHLAIAAGRRVARAPMKPAEEFGFVGLGLLFGLASGVMQTGASLGLWGEPAPNIGARLGSLGMVLCLVAGVGALLVPAFVGMKHPLMIPGVAGAHERRGRRQLYVALGALFVAAFALEAAGLAAAGAWARAIAAGTLLLWVWKVWRLPGRRDRYGFALWGSGWFLFLGLLLAALLPLHAVAAYHLTFIGGYGLLTLGIGTRVVVSHGKHPQSDEPRLYSALVVGAILLAVALRYAAEWVPVRGVAHALATSAALWIVAWIAWTIGALAKVLRREASTAELR